MNSRKNGKTFPGMILQNLVRRPFRSLMMIFLLFLFSFTVFSSSLLVKSMELGITRTVERMGADIAVVPEGYVSRLQNALFTGQPCTVHFSREWVGKIQAVEGVGKVSYQMYLSTLSDSDCCDSELQIVAFDPGTDFTVGPWVQKAEGRTLPPYGVIVGNGLKYEPGDTALFFGRRFTVEGKLDKTGMGYDHTVFMTCDTAYDLVEKSNARNFFSIGGRTDLVSMITVKVREGYDANAVIDRITNLYGKDGISVYASDSLLIGASDSLRNFRFYGGLLSGLLLVSTVFALWCVFGITANERKREFGILRTLGASGIRLAVLIAGEAEILCAAGSVSGCLAAWYLAGAFGNYLADTFRVPFLQPRLPQMLLLAGECLLLTLAAGLAASCRIAWKTGLAEPYALLRENEAG